MPKRFEPYFNRWKSVVAVACPGIPQGTPLYEHKTCGHTIIATKKEPPPRICPTCGADCEKEQIDFERVEAAGGVALEKPPAVVNLKPLSFAPRRSLDS